MRIVKILFSLSSMYNVFQVFALLSIMGAIILVSAGRSESEVNLPLVGAILGTSTAATLFIATRLLDGYWVQREVAAYGIMLALTIFGFKVATWI